MDYILLSVIVLGTVALLASVVLWTCSKRFAVDEDPRISKVVELLPGANCGGCGFAGCGGFAESLVKGADAGSLDGMVCPVSGSEVMSQIAKVLGVSASVADPLIAVVCCDGSCEHRPRTDVSYDGLSTCASMHSCGLCETGCGYGCLGCGDCCEVCQFGAININSTTGLPEVDEEKCVACGACVEACPRHIIELRRKGPKRRRVFVACRNKDKGAVAKRACAVACIGCSKCVKECKFEAITVIDNLSYIDSTKCRLCRRCVEVCPTHAIKEVGFEKRVCTSKTEE